MEGKRFHAHNLGLKSDLLRIYGSGEIGFDRSISSSLKAEVSDEAMSPGFRKNLVDAIGRYMLVEI